MNLKLPLWISLALPVSGFAQQSITLSGDVYLGLRHVSNANAAGTSSTQVGGSPDGIGSLRLAGTEDLGGGTRVSFLMDSSVQADVGVAGTSGGLWNRAALLGMHGNWGNLTAGRQVGLAAYTLAIADPLNGNSNYMETTWLGAYTGLRFNNSVQYTVIFNGLFVGAFVALGEQAQSSTRGRTTALTAGHQSGPAKLRATVQESRDGSDHRARVLALGGYRTITSAWTLHGACFSGTYEKGFAITTSNPAGALFGSAQGFGVPLVADMRTKGVILGLTWHINPQWTIKSAFHQADSKGATLISGLPGVGAGDGKQRQVYLLGDYALSRRTSLQISVDSNHWSGKWNGYWGSAAERGTGLAIDGHKARTVVGSYLKHSF